MERNIERSEALIRARLEEHLTMAQALNDLIPVAARLGSLVASALARGGKLLLFGNGGSAADSQHLAAEMVNRFVSDRPAYAAIALTTDSSCLTSIANDSSYDEVFARQVQALGRAGDVAIGISTSGNSPNVIRGLRAARAAGIRTIAFTGEGGGKLAGEAEFLVAIPSRVTARIQEGHIFIGHVICEIAEELLASGKALPEADGAGSTSLKPKETKPACHVHEPASPKTEQPDFFVHSSSYVDDNVFIGKGSKIWHFCHVQRGAQVGRGCVLGQNVNIDRDVFVGNGVKIQNNVSVYKGVVVEDDAFLGPSMVFTNVVNPRSHVSRKDEFRETRVGKGATIGANATVVCGHSIGPYAFVGAGAVVARDVPAYALVTGVPARICGWMCKCGIKLSFSEDCGGGRARCEACGLEYQKDQEGISVIETI